jgi:hypothetical protein
MDEPAVSFNQAALKIEWSNVLIENLHREGASFIEGKPYHISFQRDPEEGCYRFKVGLTRDVPPQIPLLMGDICGNLRSSLDYAWMGVIRKENPGQTERKSLPIADNRKGLISTIGDAPIKASAKQAKVLLVDVIKSHRDIDNGGNKAVVALNKLSNWNKHNLLVSAVGVTYVPSVTINCRTLKNARMIGVKVRGGICSLFESTSAECELTYDGEPTVDILFGNHDLVKDEPVVPTLRNLAQATLEALHAFCEAFPSPLNPTFR